MLSSCCRRVLSSIPACIFACAAVFSEHAEATLLQINSALSEVIYTPASGMPICISDPLGNVTCTEPPKTQTASLSGRIQLDINHEHWEFGTNVTDRDLIWLTTMDFASAPLLPKFSLGGFTGIISGENFEISEDPCFLAPFPGMCSSTLYTTVHWGSNGTWDGHKLTWTGYSYETFPFGEHLTYTIIAEEALASSNVPEPASLALAGLGLAGLGVTRRRKAA